MNQFQKSVQSVIVVAFTLLSFTLCGKTDTGDTPGPNKEDPKEYPKPVDPEITGTVGFFMNDWSARSFQQPEFLDVTKPSTAVSVTVEVDASKVLAKIPPTMFGQNAVSYVQEISNQEPIMTYLKDLNMDIIRFPGGSISDTYFWNGTFNIKPDDVPQYLYDGGEEKDWKWNYWYGKNNPTDIRTNLSDYYTSLQKTGSKGIITVNYGYARYGLSDNPVAKAAQLAADWVRYDNGRTRYWEIGNENHGAWEKGYRINTTHNKDGQPEYITGELYANHAKVFMDSMRNAAKQIGKEIYIGVGVIEEYNSWLWNNSLAAANWNRSVMGGMKGAGGADFYVIHSYFLNNEDNTVDKIIASAQRKMVDISKYVKDEMTKNGSPTRPIALTEYNIFATGSAGSMQQVSYVNGMHTTIVLCEAIKNNIGSTVRWSIASGWDNGADHGMFSKGDEPAAEKWNPRPVFYYMYYLQRMMGDRMLQANSTSNNVLSYASSFSSGEKGVILVNKSNKQEMVKINLKNTKVGKRAYWFTLTGGSDNGDFSRKVLVNGFGPDGVSGGPVRTYKSIKANAIPTDGGIHINLPPRGVIFVVVDK